jgi:hypothetical protein
MKERAGACSMCAMAEVKKNLNARDQLENVSINRRIILKLVLQN